MPELSVGDIGPEVRVNVEIISSEDLFAREQGLVILLAIQCGEHRFSRFTIPTVRAVLPCFGISQTQFLKINCRILLLHFFKQNVLGNFLDRLLGQTSGLQQKQAENNQGGFSKHNGTKRSTQDRESENCLAIQACKTIERCEECQGVLQRPVSM